ncbi:MAG TPA: septal ring lytic transglycosylase RlpA family protein [Candidatus Competibacteraceae bacterium]|mgnify:CR=1 FL=1|nr:septal ring lytic transglycosylase RlpA family protein [Candidatus Competibacteraceae bacterium]HRY19267.1 septal ring lytic transglycosylase RlpA family protein [Candidatus Competibacteraceae bacterium]
MSKSWSHALLFASLAGTLAGCSSVPDQPRLARPLTDVTYSTDLTRSDPVPQAEPPSRSGNPDTYVVFGRRYRVKETSEGHRETGIASWYGWDFHGRKTSSGPPFNMFELTAAHKSLPIPTYARVTNLENGRSIVVKVNDRGPFVGERIIDLSYAAAARLDMLNQGTAQVEVVALEPYQHLPQLAARRAEERERLARRAEEREQLARRAEEREQLARRAVEPAITGKENTPSRLAGNTGSQLARNTGSQLARNTGSQLARNTGPVKGSKVGNPVAKMQLALAAPAAKARKDKHETAKNSTVPVSRGNALYVVGMITERDNARQVQTRLSSQLQRSVQVESGKGKQYEVRVPLHGPGEAKQVAIRLASLGVSRSRIVAD